MPRISPRPWAVSSSLVLVLAVPAQTPGWSLRPSFVPGAKAGFAEGTALLASDAARGVITGFGHYPQGGSVTDTWEWGGTVWTPRIGTPVPPPRSGAQLVNDPVRGRTILFGGSDPGTINLRGDLWEWDGTSWTQRTFPVMPSPRERYGMVFDAARGRIVLYGGRDFPFAGIPASDTWEYDGASWVQRTPAHAPGPRMSHQLAYDAARQRVVTFGGFSMQNETWEWDGTDWTQPATAVAPSARTRHAMAYDAVRQRIVVCGGQPFASSTPLSDTWEWDGVQWQLRATSVQFPNLDPAAVVDPQTGALQVFHAGSVWRWNGAAWVAAQSVSFPPSNSYASTACTDTVRNRVISFDREGSTLTARTFEWDGVAWTRSPAVTPVSAAGGVVAFDAARGLTVLVASESPNMGTWEWDGATWTPRTLASPPWARSAHGLAYDAAHQACVLFGGHFFPPQQGPVYFGDTWTYDGVQWTQRVGQAPPARSYAAMAYDPQRQRVVLFGGRGYGVVGGVFDDTWEWDGAAWTPSAVAVHPSARLGAAMAYDPQRQRIVMFGGQGPGGSAQLFDDTWEWDGVAWTNVVTSPAPQARAMAAMAIDPLTQQVLLHGGLAYAGSSSIPRDDTWLFGNPVPATSSTVGVACAAGAVPLLATSTPYLGNTDFAFEVRGAPASTPGVLGLSLATQTLPLGPCTLYLQPDVLLLAFTNAYGCARVSLPLPYATWLRGVSVTAQAAVFAAPGAFAGLDFTAGRTIVIGD